MSKNHSLLQPLYFKNSEFSIEDKVTHPIYKYVCTEFNKMVSDKILEGYEFKLPLRLGSIYIKQVKQTFKFDENGQIDKTSLRVDQYRTQLLRMKKFPNMTYKEICLMLREQNRTSELKVYHYN